MNQIAIDMVRVGETKRNSVFFAQIPENVQGKVFYFCMNHDYVFVPEHFTDTENVKRRSGYYDETGKFYNNLRIIEEDEDGIITCKYCENKIDFTENPQLLLTLKCPHCDAGLEYLKEEKREKVKKKVDVAEIEHYVKEEAVYKDKFKYSKSFEQYEEEYKKNRVQEFLSKPAVKMVLLIVPALVFIALFPFIMLYGVSMIFFLLKSLFQ